MIFLVGRHKSTGKKEYCGDHEDILINEGKKSVLHKKLKIEGLNRMKVNVMTLFK